MDNTSRTRLFLENIKRTLFTALSYDFSFNLPIIGIMMSRLGHDKAAAATTTMLDALAYMQLAIVLPTSFELSRLFGELEALEKSAEQNAVDILLINSAYEKASMPMLQHTAMTAQLPPDEKIAELKIKIGRTPKNGAIVGVATNVPIFFTMLFAGPLLSSIGQDENVFVPAQTFFVYYAGFFLIFPLRYVMEFVLLSSKRQKAAMLIAGLVLLATVGFQYTLAFETSFGLSGLALAAGAGAVLTALFYSIYVTHHFKQFDFVKNLFSWSSTDSQQIVRFIKEAAPILLTMASDILIPFVASLFATRLSENAATSWNVAAQYLNINTWLIAASSQTTALMVGEQRGKAKINYNSYMLVRRVATLGLLATLILQLPLAVIASSAPALFSRFVGTDDQSDKHNLMLVTASYALLDGLRNTLLQTTRSLGDNLKPAMISTSMLWLGVGISYILSNYTNMALLGLPIGLSIGALFGTLILLNRIPKSLNAASLQDNVPSKPKVYSRHESTQNSLSNGISSWCCNFSRPTHYQHIPESQSIDEKTWACPCPLPC